MNAVEFEVEMLAQRAHQLAAAKARLAAQHAALRGNRAQRRMAGGREREAKADQWHSEALKRLEQVADLLMTDTMAFLERNPAYGAHATPAMDVH